MLYTLFIVVHCSMASARLEHEKPSQVDEEINLNQLKKSFPAGFEPGTSHSTISRFTICAISPHLFVLFQIYDYKVLFLFFNLLNTFEYKRLNFFLFKVFLLKLNSFFADKLYQDFSSLTYRAIVFQKDLLLSAMELHGTKQHLQTLRANIHTCHYILKSFYFLYQ